MFTKYDKLVARENMAFGKSQREGLSKDAIWDLSKSKASTAFMEECIAPLKERLGSQIPPYKAVSGKCAHCSCPNISDTDFYASWRRI